MHSKANKSSLNETFSRRKANMPSTVHNKLKSSASTVKITRHASHHNWCRRNSYRSIIPFSSSNRYCVNMKYKNWRSMEQDERLYEHSISENWTKAVISQLQMHGKYCVWYDMHVLQYYWNMCKSLTQSTINHTGWVYHQRWLFSECYTSIMHQEHIYSALT